jgi:glycosyltransferase A (GT-A) superfamily protein (DUF2064 family)
MKKNIFIMSKVPFKGIIKNRLSKEIGFTKSKRLIINTLEKINKIFLDKKAEYNIYWYLFPKKKFRSYSFSFSSKCILQSKGNLGDKMWNLVKFQRKPLIIIGSDIPQLNLKAISHSFNKLKTYDVVIGPTYDGGFWLIGFANRKKLTNPFNNIRWSSSFTFTDLIQNLKSNQISYDFTQKLRDIDNKDDYCENNKD